jgi:hypothetical protein
MLIAKRSLAKQWLKKIHSPNRRPGRDGPAAIKIEPVKRTEGSAVANETRRSVIPKKYVKPTQERIVEEMFKDAVAGCPSVHFWHALLMLVFTKFVYRTRPLRWRAFCVKDAMNKGVPIFL